MRMWKLRLQASSRERRCNRGFHTAQLLKLGAAKTLREVNAPSSKLEKLLAFYISCSKNRNSELYPVPRERGRCECMKITSNLKFNMMAMVN